MLALEMESLTFGLSLGATMALFGVWCLWMAERLRRERGSRHR
jgi:predicted membrane metal-binding protein